MPQMYIDSLNEHTKLAVWHITEPEVFFSSVVTSQKMIAHPHKRLQHLCGRYLLKHLAPDFPLADIVATQYNKPFLPGFPYHFSISHCDDYAAAIVSKKQKVGIDIETVEQRVLKIKSRFLTLTEETMLANEASSLTEVQRLTLAWSAKESMFKWLGEPGVDFKEHLIIEHLELNNLAGTVYAKVVRDTFYQLPIHFQLLNNQVLTWAIT